MRVALAIARREYASMFSIPLGWIVVALFLGLSGLFFVSSAIVPGAPATMRDFFAIWWGLLLFIGPAISMRLLSEEFRSGTIETMQTAPVGDAELVVGKFAAGLAFLVTMLAPTLAFVAVLEWLSRPDYGPIVSGYVGLILLGMLYLAVGCLVSSLTSSQTLAFLGTLVALVVLDVVPTQAAGRLPESAAAVLFALSPSLRAADFSRGLIDTGNMAYFLIATVWFLVLTTVAVQSRRWR